MLKVDRINVFYQQLQVLRDVSMFISKGEFVALIGSNGAGKSSLLKAIMGLLHPRSGTIEVDGVNITNFPPYHIVNHKIALVPEEKWNFPQMSVLENLLMGAYPKHGRHNLKENLERVFSLFPRLYERRMQLSQTLSGGELQMLIIARGLMSNPDILMVDELSLGLSPRLAMESFELLSKLHADEKLTLIVAEQHVQNILRIAERGIVLENGSIVMEGPAQKLLTSDQIQKKYLGM